jgi:hypothetical protein
LGDLEAPSLTSPTSSGEERKISHDFLFKLQEQADFGHRIEVRVVGLNIENQGEGLHYEPFGPDGWRARFSRYGEPPETG